MRCKKSKFDFEGVLRHNLNSKKNSKMPLSPNEIEARAALLRVKYFPSEPVIQEDHEPQSQLTLDSLFAHCGIEEPMEPLNSPLPAPVNSFVGKAPVNYDPQASDLESDDLSCHLTEDSTQQASQVSVSSPSKPKPKPVLQRMFGQARRHRKSHKKAQLSTGDIRRLARRGGVKRMHKEVIDSAKQALTGFIRGVIRDAVIYTGFRRAKTVTTMDIAMALKRQGKTLYN
jgi:histone H4